MRVFFSNLALFVIFCIAFSGLTACSGTETNVSNGNSSRANANTTKSKSSAFPPLATGLAEAEFELLDGGKFKISEKKGKVLLLNIWGTWCGPCREEMPHLVAMQQQYAERGFEVIGLNIGDGGGNPESVEAIRKFAEQMKLNYTLARSSTVATAQFYAITKQHVVPQSMVVDREGHLRGVFIGGGQRIYDSMKQTVAKTINEDQSTSQPSGVQEQALPTPAIAAPVIDHDANRNKGDKTGKEKPVDKK